jgi:4-hydroxy-L-threonine phosphate dehydrogenase PdxA
MGNKIILVTGDPNSVNSEIFFKCWKKLPKHIKKNIILISNYKLLKEQFKKLQYNLNLKKIKNIQDEKNENDVKILDIKIAFTNPFKISKKSASDYVLKSLDLAHKLGLNSNVAGIINCPINKNLLKKKYIGITEYFAAKCLVKNNSEVMIIKSKDLMVSPLTTHHDIKSITKKINKKIIIKKVSVIDTWYRKKFNKKPKIGILGLNPHNAELRKFSEERRIIIPAIKKLQKLKINSHGPLVADTIFINNFKNYDVIVGMYHDQVLAPFKALYKFDAINLTLGLKYNRVSPDHGVAKDKILSKKSNPNSLLNCIKYIHNCNR